MKKTLIPGKGWVDEDGKPCKEPRRSRLRLEGSKPKGWPLYSDSAGVHPGQRQAAYEESVKAGVPTEFDRLGRAVFRDRNHRKRYLRKMGMVDQDGGYGD